MSIITIDASSVHLSSLKPQQKDRRLLPVRGWPNVYDHTGVVNLNASDSFTEAILAMAPPSE